LTDKKSQKGQAIVYGVGMVLLGLLIGFVEIPFKGGGSAPPNLFIGVLIVAVGLLVLVYALRQKHTTQGGTP
jgi:hypothetical protein